MVRKTLSVGPDSWKALSAMGRFGMSFDDIIKILLIEHNELMRIKGQKEIPLGPSIYKQSIEAQEQAEAEVQQQSQHQQEQQVAAHRPAEVMSAVGAGKGKVYIPIPEDFPSKKHYQELLQVIKNGKEMYDKFKQRRTEPSKKESHDFFQDLIRGIDNRINDRRERSFALTAIMEDTPELGLPNLWAKNTRYEPPEYKRQVDQKEQERKGTKVAP
jgi:hypothetical protein